MDPIIVAQKVLELAEEDDYEGILNLAAPNAQNKINKTSDPNLIRKYYLKISLLIHPDKLGKKFPDATKAFQALVRAFESITRPEISLEEETSRGRKTRGGSSEAPLAISRSNENCFRTRIFCPRCKQPWNENTLDGNPDYCYNFLMTGLKQYYCSTCLCEFGCMTAIHLCPFCRKQFEYHPYNYHTQIQCPHPSCQRTFGFYLYHVSDRILKEMKKTIKDELEQKLKAKEAKQRRNARSKQRNVSSSITDLETSAFLFGLSDLCPLCGEDFTEMEFNEESIRWHLMDCQQDNQKRSQYKAKKEKQANKLQEKEMKDEEQDAIQSEAAWQLLGSQNTQLYLLNENQLQREVQRRGILNNISGTASNSKLAIPSSKDDLIDLLVNDSIHNDSEEEEEEDQKKITDQTKTSKSSRKRKAIEDLSNNQDTKSTALVAKSYQQETKAITTSSKKAKTRKAKIDVDSLPSNLQSLSIDRLKSILISHGLKKLIFSGISKSDLIDIIEEEIHGNHDDD
jgi:hypothetical protein